MGRKDSLRDLYARHALPYITFYSILATTAGNRLESLRVPTTSK